MTAVLGRFTFSPMNTPVKTGITVPDLYDILYFYDLMTVHIMVFNSMAFSP
jgi:hypothetical protein